MVWFVISARSTLRGLGFLYVLFGLVFMSYMYLLIVVGVLYSRLYELSCWVCLCWCLSLDTVRLLYFWSFWVSIDLFVYNYEGFLLI